MKTEIIAVLMIVLVIAGAGGGYLVGSSPIRVITSVSTTVLSATRQSVSTITNQITTTLLSPTTVFSTANTTMTTTVISSFTATSPPYEPCSTLVSNESLVYPYEYGNDSSGPYLTPALLMRPNTTGYVCVIFQTVWQGNASQFQQYGYFTNVTDSFEYSGNPVDWDCVYNYTVSPPEIPPSISCTTYLPHGLTVQPLPISVALTGDLNYITVVYAYTALGNSTGFYDQTAPWWSCWRMPMAVGYSAFQVNASDFNLASTLSECPPWGLNPVAEYATGMNVTYINITPIFSG